MIVVLLLILGLVFGSFINALTWRVHEKSNKSATNQDLSIVKGRSICPNCKHILAPKDLIPVISWLSLRGKCRYCGQKIEDSPLIELVTSATFVFSYMAWPDAFNSTQFVLFGIWLIFVTGLIAIAVYDLKWFIIPNPIVYQLLGLAILQAIALIFVHNYGLKSFWGAVFGLLVGGGLFYLLFQLSKGKWIGGGDVKLGALLGILVGGSLEAFLMLFMASLIGSIVALPLLVSGKAKRQTKLPFGPFLVIGAILAKLFGASIITWYKNQLL